MHDDIDALEAQLHAARQRLALAREDVRRAGRRWRRLGEHLRAHPLLVAGAAAAAGYLLLGRRGRPAESAQGALPPQRSASLPARALGAGLRHGWDPVLPILAALAWQRLSPPAKATAADDAEYQEFHAPRRPR